MISTALLKKEIKSNYKTLIIFMVIVSLYASMIVAMFDPKLGASLQMMMETMPELFSAFGMSGTASTLIEFISNYLYGFILIAIPLIFIVVLCNRLVGRYIDRGSMAYLLATPHKRRSIITTQFIMMQLGLLLLVGYVIVLVIVCSNLMFDEGIEIGKFLWLNVGLYCVLTFFGGVCFLSSCLFNEAKLSIWVGAGIGIFCLLIQMLGQVGDKMEFLKYMTPLTLFDAEQIIVQDSMALFNITILFVIGIMLSGLGILIFSKKDLSL